MKKKIIVLCGVMIFALLGFIGTTVAWLTSTGTEEQTVEVGQIKFAITNLVAETEKIVPGDSLFEGEITFENTSNVDSQLRFKIDMACDPVLDLDISYFKAFSSVNWKSYEGEDYYYYGGKEVGEGVVLPGNSVSTDFFTNLKLDGTKIGNDYQGAKITFTITFEAKQSDNVTWVEIADFDFETGLQ